jgi:hypothetical protein
VEGEELVLHPEAGGPERRLRYAINPAGELLITGSDGATVTYRRTGAEGTLPPVEGVAGGTATASNPERTANRGEGPRLWVDESIQQTRAQVLRSAPSLTDTSEQARRKIADAVKAAGEIRALAPSGFPDQRQRYEDYARELEQKAAEWSAALSPSVGR